MSFTFKFSCENGGGGGAGSLAITSANLVSGTYTVTAGDLIVCWAGGDSTTTITGVDDGGSSTFVSKTGTAGGAVFGQFWYCLASVGTGSSLTYTVTFSASTSQRTFQLMCFTPSASVTWDAENAGSTGVGSAPATGNITTSGTDGLVLLGENNEGNGAASLQTINGTGVTGTVGPSAGNMSYLAYAAGFTGAGAMTIAGSSRWVANLISFKIAGGGGSIPLMGAMML
jgi:hypothetical protein